MRRNVLFDASVKLPYRSLFIVIVIITIIQDILV